MERIHLLLRFQQHIRDQDQAICFGSYCTLYRRVHSNYRE
jgi:hypothetical protein